MSELSGIAEGQPASPGKLPKTRKSRRRRRLLQLGCLPFTLMLTGCLLLFISQVVVSRAPSWVSDPEEYLLGQRIAGNLGALVGLQVIGTWLLGLVAASTAAAAAAGQGGMLYQRLAILRRRVTITAWAVFLLRVIFLIALGVSAILIYPYIAEVQDSWANFLTIRNPYVIEIVALVSMLGTALAQWLVGPFLRLRYSMALGAWGASWTRFRHRRVWMALTARMGAGMCGSLALLWGSAFGILVIATIRRPFSGSYTLDFQRVFFPFLPEDSWNGIVFSLGLSVLIILYMVGQLVLPTFYLRLARRRLAGSTSANTRWRFADRFPEAPESSPMPE